MSYLGRSAKLSLKAQEKVSFLATNGQTSKTGLSYVPSFVEVYVNGILLTDTTDFTAVNGSSITFTVALALNDEVTVISLKTFSVADHYTKSDADTLLAAKAKLTKSATAPSSPAAGDMWFDTSSGVKVMKVYSSNAWNNATTGFSATGGTITTAGLYTIHTFASSGTFTPNKTGSVDYLVIAGGGGGGGSRGAGGGAGGYLVGASFPVLATGLTVTIGAGGAGGAASGGRGVNGSNSVFSSIIATGGGNGGAAGADTGGTGGSGGGTANGNTTGVRTDSPVQGQNGGNSSSTGFRTGGGGGAGAVGGSGTGSAGGAGGAGLASSISGSSVVRAGGGGGGTNSSSNAAGAGGAGGGGAGGATAVAGTANTGGGGGGGQNTDAAKAGAAGGSGIVIVRYLT